MNSNYAPTTIAMPVESIDCSKVAEAVAKMVPRSKTQDKTTADDLRWELTKLTESRDHHERLRSGFEDQLREVAAKLTAKNTALAMAKSLLSVRPNLRTDVADLETAI